MILLGAVSTAATEPDLTGMIWSVGLMAIAIGLSSWQRLGLAKTFAIATFRTLVQLLGVGFFLSVIFASNQPVAIIALLIGMATIAAIVAKGRIDPALPKLLKWVWLAIVLSAVVTMTYVSLLVIRLEPWYAPQQLIPLTGIVLGNAMTAASISGERLVSALRNNRVEIETHLSLGATATQAISAYRRAAIKAGLIPTINAMMIVGLVTLPGTITGQLLGGADPLVAAVYQILIMFMLALATLIASLVVTYGIAKQFFTPAMQLVIPQG
ncbi:MAG: iron export ABC transporter permease subunit FetB [Cyanobacteria bacterium J06560_2]